ncbi:MAG: DMT family transporter [Candidatus Bipolaricaulia bacterium]
MNAFGPVLLMLFVGCAITFQSLFSGTIGNRVGVMESAFIIHLGGVLLAGLILLVGMRGGNLGAWRAVPWYVYSAGFLGVLIVGGYSYAVPRLGLAASITLAIVVQLILGAVLDHFGILGAAQRSLDLWRGAGIAVLLAGTWLILR